MGDERKTNSMTKAIEIEAALLGRAIMEPMVIQEVLELLEPEHFYVNFHQGIFKTLKFLYEKSMQVTPITVAYYVEKGHAKKPLDLPHNPNFSYLITTLTMNATGIEDMVFYAAIIRECHANREIQKLTANFSNQNDLQEHWATIREKIDSLQPPTAAKEWINMEDAMINLMHQTDSMKTKPKVETGFTCLDNGIGLNPGDLVVIGARPSVGKSAFMGQIAINVAKNKSPVGIISLEMSNEQIAARVASVQTNIPFQAIYQDLYRDARERDHFYSKQQGEIAKLPIFISDQTGVNIRSIKTKAAKLAKMGAKTLIIDYLQLVSVEEKKNQIREQQVAEISKGAKLMARELDMVVILLAQLNRGATNRQGPARYPQLYDLRESGSIEQDADVVLFLHRDYAIGLLTNSDGSSTEREADLICRKWRNGNLFHNKMQFDGPTMKFTELYQQDYTQSVDLTNQKQSTEHIDPF
jgi:replicative DNA helicase